MGIYYSAWVQVGFQFERSALLDQFRVVPGQEHYAIGDSIYQDHEDTSYNVRGDGAPWEQLIDALCARIGAKWTDYGGSDQRYVIIHPDMDHAMVDGTGIDYGRLQVGVRLDWLKLLTMAPEIERIGRELAILGVACPPPTVDTCWSC